MTCRCRMSMHWNLDDGLAEGRSPRTMYGVDWRGCDLHRQPGSVGYAIGDADGLRIAAHECGGLFATMLAVAASEPGPFPATLREYNASLRRGRRKRSGET